MPTRGILDDDHLPPVAAAPAARRDLTNGYDPILGLLADLPAQPMAEGTTYAGVDRGNTSPLSRDPMSFGAMSEADVARLYELAQSVGFDTGGIAAMARRVRTRTPMRGSTDPDPTLNADYARYLENYQPPPALTDAQRNALGIDPARVQSLIEQSTRPRPAGNETMHYGDVSNRMVSNNRIAPLPADAPPVTAAELNDYMRWYGNQRDLLLPGARARYEADIAAERAARQQIPRAERFSVAYRETDDLRGQLLSVNPDDNAAKQRILQEMDRRYRDILSRLGPNAFRAE